MIIFMLFFIFKAYDRKKDREEEPELKHTLRILVLVSAIIAIAFYVNIQSEQEEILVDEGSGSSELNEGQIEPTNDPTNFQKPADGVATYIGMTSGELESLIGAPERIDASYYGYDWWVYNNSLDQYLQVGVKDGKVVTVYAIGPQVNITPFKIGQDVSEIFSSSYVDTEITIEFEGSSYRFELSEADMNTRPLMKMDNLFVQLYIDKFTGTLSSVRFVDAETLLKQRSYELVYFGNLLEVTPEEMGTDEEVQKANERQIFDITNIMRRRFGINELSWDDKTAVVAYGHSKDMAESNVFSHSSEKFGELSDRLKAGEVFYQIAGENIAANYIDAPAVMEGWLNSKGHRESLLNEQFTHIGVGVYKKHYTQNFIQSWVEEQ